MRLEGKAAIITGAARGIGREYALRFAQEGASVAIVDLLEDEAQKTAKLIEDTGGKALAIGADVTSEEQMAAAAERTVKELGRIDVLINNAALYGDLNMVDQSIEYFEKVLHINILSVVISSRAVYPSMKEQGSGSIINIASTAAYPLPIKMPPGLPIIPISGYAVSKAAVINLTKSMAVAVGSSNIRVNAIAPGVTMTQATKDVVPDFAMESLTKAAALEGALEPTDLTGTAVYLASEDSAHMTGQILVVDGGLVMVG
ncbi:MAG: SDR family oxidoreductase [Chloroflexi bacterium]|nr:SDR family oxidoreductase [Chloroflexota bacterium]